MSGSATEVEIVGAVGRVWMNRPEVHNAFDAALVAELTEAFVRLGQADAVRVIVLGGRGRSFSAGAQAQWMQAQGQASQEENVADARRLAELFRVIAASAKPTVARVQGAAIGGGVGLVAACDVAIGSHAAVFATSEVRLGLIPAVIGPYVIEAVGARAARRLFLTAERIDAAAAKSLGLLHEAVAAEQLDASVEEKVAALLAGAPMAQAEAKLLVRGVGGRPISTELIEDTVQRIAHRRAHAEAAEGLSAFLEKRPAGWVPSA